MEGSSRSRLYAAGITILLFLQFLSPAIAACVCNAYSARPAADAPKFSVAGAALSNIALDIGSLSLTLLAGFQDAPHKVAMVYAVMYDAYASVSSDSQGLSETCAVPLVPLSASGHAKERFIGYAGYAALADLLATEPAKLSLLHARMRKLGFSEDVVESHASSILVRTIFKKFMLHPPTGGFTPTNPPSSTYDAQCNRIKAPEKWQGQCVQKKRGRPCTSQKVKIAYFSNAPLISFGGARRVNELIKYIPPPPSWRHSLNKLPFDSGRVAFADQYLATLKTSGTLDDRRKFIAEFFSSAAIRVQHLALNEAVARKLPLSDSIALLFTVSAAVRDAFAGAVEIKLRYQTSRPVTVLQCAYKGRTIWAWNSPYLGVRKFVNGKNGELWRPYMQTSGHPGYVSGSAAVAGAGATVLTLFFRGGKPVAANCAVRKKGMSVVEPRIEKGAFGYIAGVTDVPNKGAWSIGYSPANDVKVCWSTFMRFAEYVTKSREFRGIHIPRDNYVGLELGKRAGSLAYGFLLSKYKKKV